MSRRTRLQTVVRVAELRETVARGKVAAAAAAVTAARTDLDRRASLLSAGRLDGAALRASTQRLALRAEAVRTGERELAVAGDARSAAAAAHTDAARRTRLLTQLADRLAAEDRARRDAADQRESDDSGTARRGRGDR